MNFIKIKNIALIFPLFFSGCLFSSAPEIAETVPSVDEIAQSEIENTAEGENLENQNVAQTQTAQLQLCEQKATECVKNLEVANDRIQVLSDNIKKTTVAKPANLSKDFFEMFVYFFKNVEQNEYSFESCGAISSFFGEGWFATFRQKLAEKKIFLEIAGRELKPEDFFGGCASNAGGMAFFLGAGRGQAVEFHLLKFDLKTNEVFPATIASGSCDDCPAKFGKRRGAFVELFGDGGTKWRYFFDKNILFTENELL